MAQTLYQLRQAVIRLMGEVITGTPGGSLAVNTFGCPALAIYENDYFNDWNGRFYLGTHKDTSFVVTAFVKSGGVVTFAPALGSAVVVGDLFELYPPDFKPEEINNAINLSISMVEQEALQDKVDATLVVAASTYEYDIPTGFLYIDQIFQESGTSDRYSPSGDLIDVRHWRILPGTTPKLWFDNDYITLTAGRKLRLVGQGIQAQLALDASTCSVNPAFIIFQAKALLHQSKIRGTGAEFGEHTTQANLAKANAENERRRLRVAGYGRKVIF